MDPRTNPKLQAAVEVGLADAAKILPSQNPLVNFVHHNPLHSFEHLGFREAVEQTAHTLGARAWCTTEYYRDAYREGRILNRDLADVLRREVEDEEVSLPGLRLTRRDATRLILLAPETGVHQPEVSAWILHEKLTSALPEGLDREAEERLRHAGDPGVVLTRLWEACDHVAPEKAPQTQATRLATSVARHLDADLDAFVEATIVRWASAYLDVGQAAWAMPGREDGFLQSALGLLDTWGTRLRPGGKWLLREARRLRKERVDGMASVCESLVDIGVPVEDAHTFVIDTLMRMPGFAGMFERLHRRPDQAPTTTVAPTRLIDFLAVRLILERAAARHLIQQRRDLPPSRSLLSLIRECQSVRKDPHIDFRRVAPFFHTALALGIAPNALENASPVELDTFRDFARLCLSDRLRWLWHLAYERRYRVQVLDALMLLRNHVVEPPPPHTQVMMCIDDREESLRRHLEEVDPQYETLGYAGYYNVAMRYQGVGERDSRALCPGAQTPTHAILELPKETVSSSGSLAASLIPTGANSGLLRSAAENMFGWAALLPMAWRLMRPEQAAERRRRPQRAATTLTLLRDPEANETAFGLPLGYTEEEMAELAATALRQMGLVKDFARLVVVLGHGSHNVNNPHAAGYNCGACAGGNGGPNGRVFAAMCNREGVRGRLRSEGIDIPPTTHFLGGVHETAGDIVELFDTDQVPPTHTADLERLRNDLLEASRRDAHERCRRFESAPLDISEEEALRHVVGRTEDLAQARPEYNHVTNALCIVGRRNLTRGLFLDRRAFLVSYDPEVDEDGSSLLSLLASMGPVGAGINLEYFFSFVDNEKYGAGTKLPHNVVGLVSVMNGSASDLRTGLVEQMIEIHEPMRLLLIVEATRDQANAAVQKDAGLVDLVSNRWLLVATVDPEDGSVYFLEKDGFEPHVVEDPVLPSAAVSRDIYTGSRVCQPPARVQCLTTEASS